MPFEHTQPLSGRCMAQSFRAREACNLRGRLVGMRPPTPVISGAHDVSLARGGETASLIPGASPVVLPGAGQACCIEDPAAFDRVVTEFLREKGLFPQS